MRLTVAQLWRPFPITPQAWSQRHLLYFSSCSQGDWLQKPTKNHNWPLAENLEDAFHITVKLPKKVYLFNGSEI